jgi:hypothetical protein
MADPQAPAATTELVGRIVEQLLAAADVAGAAEARAEVGDTARALAMLRDIEAPLYEVTTLLNAASILRDDHAG